MAQKLVSVKFKDPFASGKPPWSGLSLWRLLRPAFRYKKLNWLLFGLALLVGGFFWGQGKVISVSDGDTLTVLSKDGPFKVRLYGIDCPESAQSFGDEAAAFVTDSALFKEVKLKIMSTDQYGRSVALVALPDGKVLNELLLDNGLAWVYRDYCKDPRCVGWLLKEKLAKDGSKGLWREKNPTPPWKWRRQHPR